MRVMTENQSRATVRAELNYLAPDSRVNRRFVAPGSELNTGRYESIETEIRNARLESIDTLDAMGFARQDHRSAVDDFRNRALVETVYYREVCAAVGAWLGADLVVPMGHVLRTAGQTVPGVSQPPAGDVHVDVTPQRAPALAAMKWRESGREGQAYRRFVVSSFWRSISPPPQDWPLALCDYRSVDDDEGVPNIMIYCNNLPERGACLAPIAGEDRLPAATVFPYNRAHRWYYYPDMTRDEALLIKFYDSDRSRAWRAAHTAFQDPSADAEGPRESIETRTVAYFL